MTILQDGYVLDGMNEFERNLKRIIDFFIASICLVVFSPLFLICYFAVRREDGGPAIFKQERIGRFGRPFMIYKFRSMRTDAEKDGPALYQHENETRMTKVGKFLRVHHLDELPQLINILNGTMSIVGPRPAAVDQVEITRGGENAIAATVPCGLTSQSSLWDYIYGDQFPDEEEYNEKVLPIRLKLDVYYVKHASFWWDIKLIVWTVLAILYTAVGKYPQWMHDKLVGYAESDKV